MPNPEIIAINFSTTREVKRLLKQWAAEDDRTISSVIRQLIQQEKERREAGQDNQQSK